MPIPSSPTRHRHRRLRGACGLLTGLAVSWAGWAQPAHAGGGVGDHVDAGVRGRGGGWVRPVAGPVSEPFRYSPGAPFTAGRHRGVDLRAAEGGLVRAACAGRVAFAGRAPSVGRVVTVACGGWRVTAFPLAAVLVRQGASVRAGQVVARVGSGHHGALHVGVRRAGSAFAYVDPMVRFAPRPTPPGVVRIPRVGPAPRATVPERAPRTVPRPRLVPREVPAPSRVPVADGVAPWPVWLGLGLLLAGSTGLGAMGLGHRRRGERAARVARAPIA